MGRRGNLRGLAGWLAGKQTGRRERRKKDPVHERVEQFRIGNLVSYRTRYTTTSKTFSVKANAAYETDIYLTRQQKKREEKRREKVFQVFHPLLAPISRPLTDR